MASSAEEPHNHRHQSNPYADTAAPPPTPSIHTNISSSISTSDALSALLHRLPPTLSLSIPPRRSSINAPTLSLSDPIPTLQSNLQSTSTNIGFFHLKHQTMYPAADSLFKLPQKQKQLLFPNNNWPLGYDEDDDDYGESFCLDFSSFTKEKIGDLDLDSLREFTHEMETLGLRLIRELASVIGFENPTPEELCSQLWVAENRMSRVYPYVIGLHYVPRCQKSSLCSDSGWVIVSGQEDSVLITLGDIAQVWSNGKLKKVKGRPMPCNSEDGNNGVTVSLLVTLPVESMVFPRPAPKVAINSNDCDIEDSTTHEPQVFHSFPFEDYAWRVYHERLLLKDPLLRYRV